MFVALYEMKVKEGQETDFETSWANVTDFINQRRGSLGSRLHKTQVPGLYIAYAQWPSKDVYFDDDQPPMSDEESVARKIMRSALDSVQTLHLMEVIDDRFNQPFEAKNRK